MIQLHPAGDSPREIPTAAPRQPWIGLPMLLYVAFFAVLGVVICGAIRWVRPSWSPVPHDLQTWATTIYYFAFYGVPIIALLVSAFAFRRPVSHWPVVESMFVVTLVAAGMLSLLDPYLGKPWFEGSVLVLAMVFCASSIQGAVCGMRSGQWWKAFAGILAVLATGFIVWVSLVIFLYKVD